MSNNGNNVFLGQANGIFTVETYLVLPRSLDTVFPFFANADNLEKITPPWLRFEILTPEPIDMNVGTLIEYRLRLHGIALRWESEITRWEPPFRFVDEQRRGPYRMWIHEHNFTGSASGSEIRDFVQYIPFGGGLVNFLFVRRDVKRIFEYRTRALQEIFSKAD